MNSIGAEEIEEKRDQGRRNQWLMIFGAGWITFVLSISVPESSRMPFLIVGAALMFFSVLAMIKKW